MSLDRHTSIATQEQRDFLENTVHVAVSAIGEAVLSPDLSAEYVADQQGRLNTVIQHDMNRTGIADQFGAWLVASTLEAQLGSDDLEPAKLELLKEMVADLGEFLEAFGDE